MSQSIILPDSLSVDSRLTIGSSKKVEIRRGGQNVTVQRTTASSVSNNQISYNVVLNSASSTIIDPYCYQEVGITVTIGATGLSQTVKSYVDNLFSYRQYPFNSITATAQVQINNQSVITNPSQYCHQLTQFQDFISSQAVKQSATPVMPDQFPNYNAGVGSLKSPLNNYTVGGDHYSSPRGEFNADFVDVVNGTGTWQFTTTVKEPILNPVLDYDPAKNREGLAYNSLMNITLTLIANINRLFSLDVVTCPNVNSIVVNINSATLVQTWLTAPLDMEKPPVVLKSFNTIVCNQTSLTPFTSGSQQTVQSQSYSMTQIPKKIWVFIGDAQTDIATGYAKSDYTFSIQSISVLFNNRSALMSNYSALDLYNAGMAAEGSAFTFMQSQHYTGTVLCLDPSILFGLMDNEAPGVMGNYQLQIQAVCTNIGPNTVTPNIWVIWANDTVISTDSNSVSNLIQGFIRPEDVLAAARLPAIPTPFAETDIYGGIGFFDRLKSLGSKALNFIKENKLASKALGYLPQTSGLAPVVSALGYGKGGRKTSRKQLLQRALAY